MRKLLSAFVALTLLAGCTAPKKPATEETVEDKDTIEPAKAEKSMMSKYVKVRLDADLSGLSESEKQTLGLLIKAAAYMDEIFWKQAFGEKHNLPQASSEDLSQFLEVNYGPWDRLNGNAPFIEGVAEKPLGAGFYPTDMSKEEFEQAALEDKASLYTLLRRAEDGSLISVPYHEAYAEETDAAAKLLLEAADISEDAELSEFLKLRAEALLNDDYDKSDRFWLSMVNNSLDLVIGPIENYEDRLFGYKAAHEGYVLIKDKEWSEKLKRYATFLPDLQKGLPVPEEYKSQPIGTNAQLNAYDVVYYAGDCNAGSKTIAINLPNDERIQQELGTRRLQLKNAMRAKYDKILLPIADELIAEDQRQYISFDAFFGNTMFHEVAHGVGIKNLVADETKTVRDALKELASALEEGKADVLGLYMVSELSKQGELSNDLKENYVTFMASIFRSVRFGASSAHGRANMLRFNYFLEMGAFSRDEASGKYRVDFEKMEEAMTSLSRLILTLQGDGDYEAVQKLMQEKGQVKEQLQDDLDRLASAGIPVDVIFNQGPEVLGL